MATIFISGKPTGNIYLRNKLVALGGECRNRPFNQFAIDFPNEMLAIGALMALALSDADCELSNERVDYDASKAYLHRN